MTDLTTISAAELNDRLAQAAFARVHDSALWNEYYRRYGPGAKRAAIDALLDKLDAQHKRHTAALRLKQAMGKQP